MELLGDTRRISGQEAKQLFDAGILYIHGSAYAFAYTCFDRISEDNFKILFNKALCCFEVSCYKECHYYKRRFEALWYIWLGRRAHLFLTIHLFY
jgi:hypothetical protein